MALNEEQRHAIIRQAHANAQAKLRASPPHTQWAEMPDEERAGAMFELRQRLETKQAPRPAPGQAPAGGSEHPAPRTPWAALASTIACAMLLAASFASLPYGYYQLMRWIVCAALLLLIYQAHKLNRTLTTVALVVLVFVYNPIAPTHLTRQTWGWLNLGTIAALAWAFFINRRSAGHEK